MAHLHRPDGRIFYTQTGEGGPALVLVHGFGCEHSDWHLQVEHFAGAHRVVALDLRGHGRSQEHASGFDIVTYGTDVVALLEALSLEPAVLVGHSLGCRVVLEAARRAPGSVAGVVLVDGSRQANGDADTAARAAREAFDAAGLERFLAGLFEDMFVASSDAGIRQRIVARACALPSAVAGTLYPELARWDAAHADAALESLAAPLLVLQSTYINERRERRSLEAGDTTPWLDLIRERVPRARIEVLPGIGHFSMLEAPDSVNGHIRAFIDGLRA